MDLLASAAKRLLFLLVAIGGGTALVSLALGAIFGAPVWRSVSVGLYSVGAFLLLAGFVLGNRGPLRLRGASTASATESFWGARAVRWATASEREEALNTSVVFVALGFVLVLLGVVADERFSLI